MVFNRQPDPVILAKLNSLANHIMEIRDTQRIQGEQLADLQETQGKQGEQLVRQDTVLDGLTDDREARAAAEVQREAQEKTRSDALAATTKAAAARLDARLDWVLKGVFAALSLLFVTGITAGANTLVQQAGGQREVVILAAIPVAILGLVGIVLIYIRTSHVK